MQESKSCALPLGDSPMSTKLVPWDNPGIGWIEGLEPSASRATIWRASQLRHTHHKIIEIKSQTCSKGFEPPTHGLEGRCSIQLSYRLKERVMGIEPTYPAWKAGVLPLNYTRRCPVPESNQRHEDFQSSALPTELTGLVVSQQQVDFIENPPACQELFRYLTGGKIIIPD